MSADECSLLTTSVPMSTLCRNVNALLPLSVTPKPFLLEKSLYGSWVRTDTCCA